MDFPRSCVVIDTDRDISPRPGHLKNVLLLVQHAVQAGDRFYLADVQAAFGGKGDWNGQNQKENTNANCGEEHKQRKELTLHWGAPMNAVMLHVLHQEIDVSRG